MPKTKMLSAKDAAERLGAARSSITRLCRQGKFPNAVKIITRFGEHWEIPESDLAGIEIKMGRPRKNGE